MTRPDTPPTFEPFVCAACGAALDGGFCGACGQGVVRGRLRAGEMLRDAVAKLFDLDEGLLGTVRHLTLRPGTVIADVLRGRRKPYVPPVRYFLGAWIAVAVLVRQDAEFRELAAAVGGAMPGSRGAELPDSLLAGLQWVLAIEVPILAVALGVTFGPWQRTFGERLAIASYLFGHRVLLSVPLAAAATAIDPAVGWVGTALVLGWETWAAAEAHRGDGRAGRTLRAAAATLGAHAIVALALFAMIATAYAVSR